MPGDSPRGEFYYWAKLKKMKGSAGSPEGGGETPGLQELLRHLGYVQSVAGLRKQRGQFKCFEAVAADLCMAIESRFAVDGFVPAMQVFEKLLGGLLADLGAYGAR